MGGRGLSRRRCQRWRLAAGLHLLGEEVEDDLGAHAAVDGRTRPRQLVALGREAVERHVLAEQPQGDEQLLGLDDRAAQVVLGVEQQHRHVDVADVADRRHPRVLVGVLDDVRPVDGAERRGDVARPLLGEQVVDGPLAADGAEPVAVPAGEHRGHVAAVAAAEHADPVGVAEPVAGEGGVEHGEDVVDVDRAPAGAGDRAGAWDP